MVDDRHGLVTEFENKVGLVQTKRKKGRGRRNKAAVGNDANCEQKVFVDVVDDVSEIPKDMDVAVDNNFVGCNIAVLEPGEQDRTSHADVPDDLDGTRGSSTDEGCCWKDTRWYTPKTMNKSWRTFSWSKRPWWCFAIATDPGMMQGGRPTANGEDGPGAQRKRPWSMFLCVAADATT